MFKALKIIHRLGIGFGTLAILTIGLGSMALYQTKQLSELPLKWEAPLQAAHTAHRATTNLIKFHTAVEKTAHAQIPQALQMAILTMETLERAIISDLQTEAPLEKPAIAPASEWRILQERIRDRLKDGDLEGAIEITTVQGSAHMERVTHGVTLLNDAALDEADHFFRRTKKRHDHMMVGIYGTMILALSMGLLSIWLLGRTGGPCISKAIAEEELAPAATDYPGTKMPPRAENLSHIIADPRDEGRSTTQDIPIILWTTDTQLTMTYMNHPASILAKNPTNIPTTNLIGTCQIGEIIQDENELWGTMARKSLLSGMQHDMTLFFGDQNEGRSLRCITAPLKDTIDRVVGVIGVGIDITQRIKMEERLKESESHLEEAQRIAHLGHWEYDIKKDQITCSRELYRIFGLSPIEEPIPLAFLKKMVHSDQHPRIHEIIQSINNEGRVAFEEYITLPDGHHRWITGRGLLAKNEAGEPLSAFGTIQDITEHTLVEKEHRALEKELYQSQKLQAIGTLAGGIAHDFNNILATILGFSELLLEETPLETPHHQYVQEILKASQRARDLVKQILHFSRQANQNLTPVFLQPVIREAVDKLRDTLPSSLIIDLSLTTHDEKPIMADTTQIHQLIMNLGTNAIHAMGEKGHRISITLEQMPLPAELLSRHPQLTQGDYQHLTVADEGCGITPEILARIFEPFFTTKGPKNGTGMGLSVVHGIVKSLKGTIEVESHPNIGTHFSIYLPTVADDSTSPPLKSPALDPGESIPL